jgi:hypothetical protein
MSMTASYQSRGKLNVEYLYETHHENGSKILGRRIWKFDMSMKDMERVQTMSLHDECLAISVYS